MMPRCFVGRVCVAMGICLVLLALGAYQAHAACNNTLCDKSTCVGGDPTECPDLICDAEAYMACWWCQCQKNPIHPPVCNCTP